MKSFYKILSILLGIPTLFAGVTAMFVVPTLLFTLEKLAPINIPLGIGAILLDLLVIYLIFFRKSKQVRKLEKFIKKAKRETTPWEK